MHITNTYGFDVRYYCVRYVTRFFGVADLVISFIQSLKKVTGLLEVLVVTISNVGILPLYT